MIDIFPFLLLLLLLLTFILLLIPVLSLAGWRRLRINPGKDFTPLFTILIPFRNEAESLPALLHSLERLDYPVRAMDILFLDDHSTDGSAELVEAWSSDRNFVRLIHSPANGKKNALSLGVEEAKGELIITTDADCILPVNWLRSFAAVFSENDVQLSPGLVSPFEARGLVANFAALEMAALTGVSAGMAGINKPVSCNGANLAYRKSAFRSAGGYAGNMHIPSGDDEFLLAGIRQVFPDGIWYNTDSKAVVQTRVPYETRAFLGQRIRWATKWRHHSGVNKWAGPALVVSYVALLALWTGSMISSLWFWFALAVTGLKVTADLLLLHRVYRQWQKKVPAGYFIVSEFLYPFYVIIFALLAQKRQYEWKGRRYEEVRTKEY